MEHEALHAGSAPPAAGSDNRWRGAGRLVGVVLLLGIGALLARMLYVRGGPPGLSWRAQWIAVALAALAGVAALVLPRRRLDRIMQSLREPSARARNYTAAMIWAVAVVYLTLTAFQQRRDLFPRIHDECSYTIQARMLSQGRLWMPQHELADFFETFHFLTRPVYGSIYFPGTALLNVPGIWLRQPSWVMPVFLAGLAVAFCYLVAAEMVDGIAGLAAALLLLSTCLFRTYSTMVMAQVPALLLGLLVLWSWLQWRKQKHAGWALAIGIFAGWAAITRPVDALAFAAPVGVAMLLQVPRMPRQAAIRALIGVVIGAVPFLALQAAFDWGVTGKPWKTPYVMYLQQNQPGSVFGESAAATPRPQTHLLQKEIYFAQLTGAEKAHHRQGVVDWFGRRVKMAASVTFPCAIVLMLLPAGLLAPGRRRWALLAIAPLFLVLYAANPFFLLHYSIPLAAVAAIAAVLGARAVQQCLPFPAYRRFAGAFLTSALALLAVGSLPQLNRHVTDEQYHTPALDFTNFVLQRIPGRAVVLFRFTPRCDVNQEPVYNMDVACPDDARIIRAQDLGPRDGELLRYYALRQPGRSYYLIDRATFQVIPLGNAVQAARLLHVPLDLPQDAIADVR